MKKLFSFLLVFCFTAMLVSCGEDEPLLTMKQTDNIKVNADGSFLLEGTAGKMGTSLSLNGTLFVPIKDNDGVFSHPMEMYEVIKEAIITATNGSKTETVAITFDTSEFESAIEQADLESQKALEEQKQIENSMNEERENKESEKFTETAINAFKATADEIISVSEGYVIRIELIQEDDVVLAYVSDSVKYIEENEKQMLADSMAKSITSSYNVCFQDEPFLDFRYEDESGFARSTILEPSKVKLD